MPLPLPSCQHLPVATPFQSLCASLFIVHKLIKEGKENVLLWWGTFLTIQRKFKVFPCFFLLHNFPVFYLLCTVYIGMYLVVFRYYQTEWNEPTKKNRKKIRKNLRKTSRIFHFHIDEGIDKKYWILCYRAMLYLYLIFYILLLYTIYVGWWYEVPFIVREVYCRLWCIY